MKKVLLGLLTLAAFNYATPLTINSMDSTTSVFETRQSGRIALQGKLGFNIPTAKYVVFASADGTSLADAEDTLVLPDFIITADKSNCGFAGKPNSIYVKKVGNGNILESLTSETMKVIPKFDSSYVNINRTIEVTSSTPHVLTFEPIAFFPESDIEDMGKNAFPFQTTTVSTAAELVLAISTNKSEVFRALRKVAMTVELGKITFSDVDANIEFGKDGTMTRENSIQVLSVLKGKLTRSITLQIIVS